MKKITMLLCVFVYIFALVGCSSNSILSKYPLIEKEFEKKDYEKLSTIVNDNKELTYSELKYEFIKKESDEVVNDLFSQLENISNIEVEDFLKKEDIWRFELKINVDKNKTTKLNMEINPNDKELKSISFKIDNLSVKDIINLLDIIDPLKNGDDIYDSITDEQNVKNKIYSSPNKNFDYYYLPLENNTVTMYTSKYFIDKQYTSFLDYMDEQIKENEEWIEHQEDIIEKMQKGEMPPIDDYSSSDSETNDTDENDNSATNKTIVSGGGKFYGNND